MSEHDTGREGDIRENEPVLANDCPMYGDYWYVIDGKPVQSDFYGISVADYKRRTGAKEVRRCNAVERGLLTW